MIKFAVLLFSPLLLSLPSVISKASFTTVRLNLRERRVEFRLTLYEPRPLVIDCTGLNIS